MYAADDLSDSGSEISGFSENEAAERLVEVANWSDISLSDWEVVESDEDEEGIRREWEILEWSEETHDVVVSDFTNQNRVGPNVALPQDASVLDYFFLMFPERHFGEIARQTNRYASQKIETHPDRHWFPTDEDGREMKAFFAMNILMGLHDVPAYEWFWSEDERMNCPGISKVMTKSRYEKLQQYLHLVDNDDALPRDDRLHDPLFKVRPLLDDATERFTGHYFPGREVSVDEAMIGFKGRLSMKNYMPAKPTKWGIKVWMLCDPRNGYCCNFQVYTGKERNVAERGLAHRVVMDLMRPYLGVGHHVYYDNFFASVPLQQNLLEHDTYACSTVRLNRRGLPREAKTVKLRRPGEVMVRQSDNHMLTVWYDKRQVAILSSNQNPGSQQVQRHNGWTLKPNAIVNYNANMGGVDLADQLRSYYMVGRESKKWWKYVLWFIVNVSVVNAWILYDTMNPVKRKKKYSQIDFRLDLEQQLRAGFTSRKNRVGRTSMAKRTVDNLFNQDNIGPHESVKIPASVNKRQKLECRQCKVFGRKTGAGRSKETTFFCTVCHIPLCRDKCHMDYHANVRP